MSGRLQFAHSVCHPSGNPWALIIGLAVGAAIVGSVYHCCGHEYRSEAAYRRHRAKAHRIVPEVRW